MNIKSGKKSRTKYRRTSTILTENLKKNKQKHFFFFNGTIMRINTTLGKEILRTLPYNTKIDTNTG